jgi:DNA polymerase type B, organellar and viral
MAAHFLRLCKKVSVPSAMVCVGYTLRRTPGGPDCTSHGRYDLEEACLQRWELSGSRYVKVADAHVLQSVDFLGEVQSLLRPSCTTWVWASYLHRLLSCVGFYQSLEAGDWQIADRARGSDDVDGKPRRKKWAGYLNCNERSFTCLCRHTASGFVALLCDTRNYDVTPGEINGQAEARAKEVVLWCSGIAKLVEKGVIGSLRPTAAGTSVAAYSCSFADGPILCHQNRKVASLERSAYWPGRCECFRLGKIQGPIYHLDITSAYPAACIGSVLPTRLRKFWQENPPSADSLLAKGWLVVASVRVRSYRRAFPSSHSGRTVWPIGVWDTVLCGPELADAYAHGEVVGQGATAIYSGYPALDSWSRYWIKLRDRHDIVANPYLRGAVKCITNRLYGCFARRTRQWKACNCSPPPAAFSTWYAEQRSPGHVCGRLLDELRSAEQSGKRAELPATQWRSVAWRTEYMTAPEDHDDACVAISAWVASLCRMRLYGLLCCAGFANTLYTDTDSVFVDELGYRNLAKSFHLDQRGPGSLRLVGVYPSILIRSPKNYDVGTKSVHAGLPANAVIDSDGKYTWDECESMYSAMRQNIAPSGRVAGRTRTLPDRWLPGSCGPDGTVYPVFLGEDT